MTPPFNRKMKTRKKEKNCHRKNAHTGRDLFAADFAIANEPKSATKRLSPVHRKLGGIRPWLRFVAAFAAANNL